MEPPEGVHSLWSRDSASAGIGYKNVGICLGRKRLAFSATP